MWAQLLALSITAAIWTMGLAILELAKVGRGTPIVFIAIMVRTICMGMGKQVRQQRVIVNGEPSESPSSFRAPVRFA